MVMKTTQILIARRPNANDFRRSSANETVEFLETNGHQLLNLRSPAMHGRLTPVEAVILERTIPETHLPNSIRTAIDMSQGSHLQNFFTNV